MARWGEPWSFGRAGQGDQASAEALGLQTNRGGRGGWVGPVTRRRVFDTLEHWEFCPVGGKRMLLNTRILEGLSTPPATVAVISADSERIGAHSEPGMTLRHSTAPQCLEPVRGRGLDRRAPGQGRGQAPPLADCQHAQGSVSSAQLCPPPVFFQGPTGASQTAPPRPSPPVPPPLLPPILTPWSCFPQSCPPASPLKRGPLRAPFIPSQPPTRPWTLRKRPQVPEVRARVCLQAQWPASPKLWSQDPEGSDPGERK